MKTLQQTQTDCKPARRNNGFVFGSVQDRVLYFHAKTHSISLQAIGVDAPWMKANWNSLRLITARVDSLNGLYGADIDVFKSHSFERTLRSDFGPQLFLRLSHWRLIQENPANQLELPMEASHKQAA